MSITIGIPRSLYYYKFYPLWNTFFEELGAKVVVSDHTSKYILDQGVKSCVDEACLPVKIFHGHVLNLKDRVDCLFIPRFTSISKNEYICPKFGGLPDVVRNTLSGLPAVIDTEVNLRKSGKNALLAAYDAGKHFCADKRHIRKAFDKAVMCYRQYKKQLMDGKLPGDIFDKKAPKSKAHGAKPLNIAVIGHEYNLYDRYVNMNLLQKLKSSVANIITVDMLSEELINEKTRQLPKRMFWNFGRRAVGAALHLLERKDIDGVIFIMSFGCGVDSFVCDLVERRIRRESMIPFLVLTIDEHSGEAGMDTRLEAFIDMIRWRCSCENNLPAYG
ncbi:MAG: acyl-CoA dehydratase activase-related protein [Clostridia bacterium]|nr:acyl-CoA dehydratase activase-related protein [Clostridia bacterium]